MDQVAENGMIGKTRWQLGCLIPFLAFLYYFTRHHSLSYLAGGSALLGLFCAAYLKWDKMRTDRYGMALFALAMAGLPALGLWQYLQLRDPGDVDHASYACALWNMARGATYYSINDMDFFGTHADYAGLLWIPVQALAGETGLKIGKGLCLLIAAWLAIRRLKGQERIATWGGAALLLSPPIASQFFNGFHLEFIAAPVLVLAFDAYRDKRLGRFLAYTGFLAYSKEIFTLAIGGILLVALVERRPWKWILLPGLLCCAQMAVYWFVILPRFAPQGNNLAMFMPSSPGQILAMWLRPNNLYYAFHLALPFLPLMLALPKRYLLLPLPLFAFYMAFPDPLFQSLWAHYSFPLAFMCFGGLLLHREADLASPIQSGGVAKEAEADSHASLDRLAGPAGSNPALALGETRVGRALMTCAFVSLLCYPIWRMVLSVPKHDAARLRDFATLRSLVPDTASLLINASFTARFAARKDASDWVYRKKPITDFDCILLDAAFTSPSHGSVPQLQEDVTNLKASPDWNLAFERGSLYLFKKKPPVTAVE
ncbi:MAG: DUF2079 domain-containing protein [Fibrobacteria bacterium]